MLIEIASGTTAEFSLTRERCANLDIFAHKDNPPPERSRPANARQPPMAVRINDRRRNLEFCLLNLFLLSPFIILFVNMAILGNTAVFDVKAKGAFLNVCLIIACACILFVQYGHVICLYPDAAMRMFERWLLFSDTDLVCVEKNYWRIFKPFHFNFTVRTFAWNDIVVVDLRTRRDVETFGGFCMSQTQACECTTSELFLRLKSDAENLPDVKNPALYRYSACVTLGDISPQASERLVELLRERLLDGATARSLPMEETYTK